MAAPVHACGLTPLSPLDNSPFNPIVNQQKLSADFCYHDSIPFSQHVFCRVTCCDENIPSLSEKHIFNFYNTHICVPTPDILLFCRLGDWLRGKKFDMTCHELIFIDQSKYFSISYY